MTVVAPEIIWDCHAHHFGSAASYPPIANRGYDPPAVGRDDYLGQASAAGVTGTVWVQPSVYGLDNAAVLDLLETRPSGTRAVIAPPNATSPQDLRRLHDLGVRGLRLNLVSKGGNGLETLAPFKTAMQDLGWHVAAFVDGSDDAALDAVLSAVDVPVVLDHFGFAGRAMPELSVGSAFSRHLDSGRLWVKLSAGYQIDAANPSGGKAADRAARLLERAPERLLFGSN